MRIFKARVDVPEHGILAGDMIASDRNSGIRIVRQLHIAERDLEGLGLREVPFPPAAAGFFAKRISATANVGGAE